jgi:Response regulator containing a CheY-like receiver domain and an HTH DNA-binding domain
MDWVFTPNIQIPNITENETDLYESKQLLYSILNSIQDGISILDGDLNVRFINTSMQHWYLNHMPIIGQKCYKIYHNRVQPCENCPILPSIQQRVPNMAEVKYTASGYDKGWQELYSIPIFDVNNNLLAIIEYVRDITFQKKMELELNKLNEKFQNLERQNDALLRLLNQREKDREQFEENITNNMENFIKPSLKQLEKIININEIAMVEALIEEIVYPVTKKRSRNFENMTSREIQISTLIKEGKTSKEIADILTITIKAVDFHRANIRKKLGLIGDTGAKINLRAYLLSHL